jgi:hypothetical protein
MMKKRKKINKIIKKAKGWERRDGKGVLMIYIGV